MSGWPSAEIIIFETYGETRKRIAGFSATSSMFLTKLCWQMQPLIEMHEEIGVEFCVREKQTSSPSHSPRENAGGRARGKANVFLQFLRTR